MLEVKEFVKDIHRVETVYVVSCIVVIDDREQEVSAIITEEDYYTGFEWNYGIEGISDEDLEDLKEEMLDKLHNN
jgi:hypothetical protein